MTNPAVDRISAPEPRLLRSVLGHYPTGVVLVTAPGPAPAPAMVVGTFTSVSLDPPLVGFLPARTSTSWPRIRAAGRFCVNVLAADQHQVCLDFVARADHRWDRVVRHAPSGAPVLADALAWIDCDLAGEVEAGDHSFVTGLVRCVCMQRAEPPLLFLRGGYARPAAEPVVEARRFRTTLPIAGPGRPVQDQ
ncbi:MAG TPA: flavin reductase family protein [Pseudonocardiaceae bacterium]|jgi:flavin reductase (DIM6/NTAB) family NADH-FMN oxidoreductase RutF|nr:flavin reductase family protein [Pseudonocardiaceae bacterium]